MDEEIWEELLPRVEIWAVDQKRITNKMIRDRFDVTEGGCRRHLHAPQESRDCRQHGICRTGQVRRTKNDEEI